MIELKRHEQKTRGRVIQRVKGELDSGDDLQTPDSEEGEYTSGNSRCKCPEDQLVSVQMVRCKRGKRAKKLGSKN